MHAGNCGGDAAVVWDVHVAGDGCGGWRQVRWLEAGVRWLEAGGAVAGGRGVVAGGRGVVAGGRGMVASG